MVAVRPEGTENSSGRRQPTRPKRFKVSGAKTHGNRTECRLRVGYELIYNFSATDADDSDAEYPFIREARISSRQITWSPTRRFPSPPIATVSENWCSRIKAPAGRIRLTSTAVVRDSGQPDTIVAAAGQHAVEDLPEETLVFLLGSRYCETDRLSETAWQLFNYYASGMGPGSRRSATSSTTHIAFGYEHARATKTAWEAFQTNAAASAATMPIWRSLLHVA